MEDLDGGTFTVSNGVCSVKEHLHVCLCCKTLTMLNRYVRACAGCLWELDGNSNYQYTPGQPIHDICEPPHDSYTTTKKNTLKC